MNKLNYTPTPSVTFSPHPIAYYTKWMSKHWFELLIGSLLIHLVLSKDVKISFQFQDKAAYASPATTPPIAQTTALFDNWEQARPSTSSSSNAPSSLFSKTVPKAQSFYNLTFVLSPDYAARKGIPTDIVNEKKRIVQNYIEKYLKTAKEEQAIYQIPTSITLAQGLLESNAGDSKLSKESNNHFGIKCKSKCKGCTCRNYHDDDYYDMFRVFNSPWESYREHSILLSGGRYKHLKEYGNDYRQWAYGLKKAGYATDKKYAEKLIKIIEELHLYQLD